MDSKAPWNTRGIKRLNHEGESTTVSSSACSNNTSTHNINKTAVEDEAKPNAATSTLFPAVPGAFAVVPSASIPASLQNENIDSVIDLEKEDGLPVDQTTSSLHTSSPPPRTMNDFSSTKSLQVQVSADLVDEERERQRDEAVVALTKFHSNTPVAETIEPSPNTNTTNHTHKYIVATAVACLVMIVIVGVAVPLAVVNAGNSNNEAPAAEADGTTNNHTSVHVTDSHTSQPCFQSSEEFKAALSLFFSGNDQDKEKALTKYGNPVGTWCVSPVSSFAGMDAFPGLLSKFDQDLSLWDTAMATNMSWMFFDATIYNHPIALWNTSSVTDMSWMFHRAASYNQPMSLWNTSRVTTMRGMFNGAKSYNQPLDLWNTSRVTDMSEMFHGAEAFNGQLSGWDVSNVISMQSMFAGAMAFDQDLSGWNLNKAVDLSFMFSRASRFNRSLCTWGNLISPDTNVTAMFSSTSCLTEQDPNLTAVPPGPFCHPCSNN